MNIYILTLFPEVFEGVFKYSILKRAQDKKILKLKLINIRQFGVGKHKQVDDKPYGGGEGMVMMPGPTIDALSRIKPKPYTILLSASGKGYTQADAKRLSKKKDIALICGHYEGTDARIEEFADEVLSTGDYVLTGGEIPSMTIIDTITRLLPGVINPKSTQNESFEENQLEYPQYTRPEIFKNLKVPQVLLSGDHKAIENWRRTQSITRTKKFRPDLQK